ncbi:hypothetical protein BC940DRAFT_323254 [Gongronella butleri]|nr:hypothetical protein BC940DRAFT_323254 [Gongronella butleri]
MQLTPSPSPSPPPLPQDTAEWATYTPYSPPMSPLPLPPGTTLPWEVQWKSINIEQLTLENAKLQRANRLLKVASERRVAEHLEPLDRRIEALTEANVRWQRAARLLQQDLDDTRLQFQQWKQRVLANSQWMGPEYQFLVKIIHVLQLQAQGNGDDEWETRDTNEPSVTQLQQAMCENYRLLASPNEQRVQQLEMDLQAAHDLLDEQSHDILTLKNELQHKDHLVSSLEKELNAMDDRLDELQELVNGAAGPLSLLPDLQDTNDTVERHWTPQDHLSGTPKKPKRPTSSIYSASTLMTSRSSFSGPDLSSLWKDAVQQDTSLMLPGSFPSGPFSTITDLSDCFALLTTAIAIASFLDCSEDLLIPLTLLSLLLWYGVPTSISVDVI